jgi:hypothetical protein
MWSDFSVQKRSKKASKSRGKGSVAGDSATGGEDTAGSKFPSCFISAMGARDSLDHFDLESEFLTAPDLRSGACDMFVWCTVAPGD